MGEKITRHAQSPHFTFWKNLQEGYLFFERAHRPPHVIVDHNQYIFDTDEQEGYKDCGGECMS